jgi:hypothetical protein
MCYRAHSSALDLRHFHAIRSPGEIERFAHRSCISMTDLPAALMMPEYLPLNQGIGWSVTAF